MTLVTSYHATKRTCFVCIRRLSTDIDLFVIENKRIRKCFEAKLQVSNSRRSIVSAGHGISHGIIKNCPLAFE